MAEIEGMVAEAKKKVAELLEGVRTVDPFSEDFEIDDFDLYSSAYGVEIRSAGGFSAFTMRSAPYSLHGFHVHALGDTINGCMSTGPHFNLAGKEHGAPEDKNYYAGDLGNVTAGKNGTINFSIVDKQIPLSGPNFIIERAVVVHADPDDLEKDKLYSNIHVNFIFY
ncbi:superoxide dismutase [Cu-Zn]-like [Elaeis guineensis]|uniref:superoxide dismutase [Cu-Zn]-like n=1 Tax=Elaeis guineensis var. tenera TaxID=51953 RepID=UPI003C6D0CE1